MKNALAAFLLLTALLLAETGRAATVTTTADDGPGSLRETIANAAAGETIDFSVTGLITLTSGKNEEIWLDRGLTRGAQRFATSAAVVTKKISKAWRKIPLCQARLKMR